VAEDSFLKWVQGFTSVKIMRCHRNPCQEGQALDFLGEEGGDVILGLGAAFELKEALLGDDGSVVLKGGGGHEGIADAGLVLKGDEDVSFGGAGALAADDLAPDEDGRVMLEFG